MEKKKGDICIVNKALFTKDKNHPAGYTIPVNTRLIINIITEKYFWCTLDTGYNIGIELEHDCSLTIITDNKKINKFKQQLAENNNIDVNFEEPILKESKPISSKIFTIKVEILEDGRQKTSRINDGFNINELMGIICFTQQEICKTLAGEIKPDVIKRTVIVD